MIPNEPTHRTFVAACRATWVEAPSVVAGSVVWALSALPVVAAMAAAFPVPSLLLSLPFLLVTTGVFRLWAAVAGGRPIMWRVITGLDPGLALIAWCLALAIEFLPAIGGLGLAAASALAAFGALTLPLAFAYGAVRNRRGLAAIHGGVLLAILRPDLALTLAALAVLACFAIVVSAGALVLCVPALVAIFGCVAVAADLRRLGAVAP
jgi:hypothetical protein